MPNDTDKTPHENEIKNKLKDVTQHIHASDISPESKESLLAKTEELEQAIGTSKFEQIYQEFVGLVLEYEQYLPAVLELFKL